MLTKDESLAHPRSRMSQPATQPYTSGATRAAHRLAEKLAADLERLGPLRNTLVRQQVRREQRKAAKR